ncbi:MAG: hypothetical protein V3R87_01760 [Dehalococcoidia bacterium]
MRICHSLAIVLALAVLPILFVPGSAALAAAPEGERGGFALGSSTGSLRRHSLTSRMPGDKHVLKKEKAAIIDMIEDRLKRDGGHDR